MIRTALVGVVGGLFVCSGQQGRALGLTAENLSPKLVRTWRLVQQVRDARGDTSKTETIAIFEESGQFVTTTTAYATIRSHPDRRIAAPDRVAGKAGKIHRGDPGSGRIG
jgi:hypothetical protein